MTPSFDIFFDVRLNKRLSEHSWGWWFETPSRPLWLKWFQNLITSSINRLKPITFTRGWAEKVSLVIHENQTVRWFNQYNDSIYSFATLRYNSNHCHRIRTNWSPLFRRHLRINFVDSFFFYYYYYFVLFLVCLFAFSFWFVTCQNLQFLASMFVCRFVTCQNLQFLASMFVCRFVTCQNLQFWQVCSFVGLLLAKIYNFWQVCSFVGVSVCLSVSLSVLSSITHERFDISSPNLVHIWNGWAVPVCDIDK